ncbi:MAG: protein translocase subunit SecD [Proteobacteria bacterium]|jgi:preprotein translocase subunit SecD|nr:protein translocase subunit SecD [Pseudomonadota bacterium]MBT5064770.1 protein translocase subunit SecD [Pseudomonadota bacterium]MBT6194114.1 protein translocase subunit SecD [Pseudomonadota bacterium]MBT6465409.1 protein translocase subunit SecD [Pseudomonadota bacterium]MBT6674966.1 protein translocase subunit SecD [Pseudomonadota bacterium]
MNQYSKLRYIAILAVFVLGCLYALPNFYGHDPALQISSLRGNSLGNEVVAQVNDILLDNKIPFKSIGLDTGKILVRFSNSDERDMARDLMNASAGLQNYVMALSLANASPEWLQSIGGKPMSMGLDLRGGVHFLMEVDTKAVAKQSESRFISEIKNSFRKDKIRYRSIVRGGIGIQVAFINADMKERGLVLLSNEFPGLEPRDNGESTAVELSVSADTLADIQKTALQQNLQTLRNRVNEFGVSEPVIQQQGINRIVVQLPGVEDTAEAKKILGATATLEFRMVDATGDIQAAVAGKVPIKSKLYSERNGNKILLQKNVILTGEYIIDASSGLEAQSGSPAVFITLNGKGARVFSRVTGQSIGKPMAVVYIEQRKGRAVEEVISVATIQGQLGKRFQISGLDSTQEARTLALLLRAGALAAPIEIIEERTVGPTLGKDNIDRGFRSMVFGLSLVLIFMAVYYRGLGLVANFALTFNVILICALLSVLQATLTLPGIAGIVLTVGMAVDANVLIFQRIREEVANGNSPQSSISAGYDKAFSTIADASITTLIAAIVLFSFGTGPIKGFAVTLCIGILTSMFTAIAGSRAIVNLVFGKRRLLKVSV